MKVNDIVVVYKTPKNMPRSVDIVKKTGRVVYIGTDIVGIEFDFYIPMDGHNCDGYGRTGYCYYIDKNCLEETEVVAQFIH